MEEAAREDSPGASEFVPAITDAAYLMQLYQLQQAERRATEQLRLQRLQHKRPHWSQQQLLAAAEDDLRRLQQEQQLQELQEAAERAQQPVQPSFSCSSSTGQPRNQPVPVVAPKNQPRALLVPVKKALYRISDPTGTVEGKNSLPPPSPPPPPASQPSSIEASQVELITRSTDGMPIERGSGRRKQIFKLEEEDTPLVQPQQQHSRPPRTFVLVPDGHQVVPPHQLHPAGGHGEGARQQLLLQADHLQPQPLQQLDQLLRALPQLTAQEARARFCSSIIYPASMLADEVAAGGGCGFLLCRPQGPPAAGGARLRELHQQELQQAAPPLLQQLDASRLQLERLERLQRAQMLRLQKKHASDRARLRQDQQQQQMRLQHETAACSSSHSLSDDLDVHSMESDAPWAKIARPGDEWGSGEGEVKQEAGIKLEVEEPLGLVKEEPLDQMDEPIEGIGEKEIKKEEVDTWH